MKLSIALSFLLASVASAATSSKSVFEKSNAVRANSKSNALRSLVKQSRRVEEGQQDGSQDAYDFLQYYDVKFVSCKADEPMLNDEGAYEYGAVVFRLCPAEDCADDASMGCSSGYGDMVVGINSFVDAYFEMKREDWENDASGSENAFQLQEYSNCRQFEMQGGEEGGENRRRKLEEAIQFYVGPACTEDEDDIMLGWFSDEDCTTVETTYTYEAVTGDDYGLPYSTGGVIGTECISCYEMGDNSEYGVAEFCTMLYQDSKHCETEMEAYSDYGKDESSCEYIEELMPATSGLSAAGKAFFWILLIALIGGVGYWFFMQQKKKQAARSGVDNSGLMT